MRDVAAVPNLLATPSASTRLANWNAKRPHLSLAPSFLHWHDLIHVSTSAHQPFLVKVYRERTATHSDFITSKIQPKKTACWGVSRNEGAYILTKTVLIMYANYYMIPFAFVTALRIFSGVISCISGTPASW
jgi:hypothetical protein